MAALPRATGVSSFQRMFGRCVLEKCLSLYSLLDTAGFLPCRNDHSKSTAAQVLIRNTAYPHVPENRNQVSADKAALVSFLADAMLTALLIVREVSLVVS